MHWQVLALVVAPVVGAAGCAAPASPLTPPRRAEIVVAPPTFIATPATYEPPVELAVQQRCPAPAPSAAASVTGAAAAGKVKAYDFTGLALDASFGFTPTTQPRSIDARDPDAIRTALVHATPRLADCARAALAAGMQATRTDHRGDFLDVNVELVVDPFGAVSDVQVDAPPQLAPCVVATLLAVQVPRQATVQTHVSVRLDYSTLSSAKPLKIVPPLAPIAPVRGHCFVANEPLHVVEVTLPSVPIDFAASPPRPPRSPSRWCPQNDVDKAQIRRAVLAVLGDLRGCYLGALVRQPALAGTVTSEFVVGPLGELTQIAITGPGDDELHTCLADALASTATTTYPAAPIQVTFPFVLTRSTAETGPLERRAASALVRGDREAAAAAYAELARTATTAQASCRARAAMVLAYAGTDLDGVAKAQPPLLDPRTMTAIEALATFVDANRAAGLAACLDEIAPILVRIGRAPIKNDEPFRMKGYRGQGLAEAIDRSQVIATLFPQLERTLLPFIADGFAMLLEYDDAREAYLRFLALGNDDPKQVTRAADGYAHVTRMRDEDLPWDDCPR